MPAMKPMAIPTASFVFTDVATAVGIVLFGALGKEDDGGIDKNMNNNIGVSISHLHSS